MQLAFITVITVCNIDLQTSTLHMTKTESKRIMANLHLRCDSTVSDSRRQFADSWVASAS